MANQFIGRGDGFVQVSAHMLKDSRFCFRDQAPESQD